LEYIEPFLYANIYQTDRIARIDPATGKVHAYIDLRGILPAALQHDRIDVLNGIAYDSSGDRLFVTGKMWPRIYEIVWVQQ
jgi:glutamine cyclotransferase